MSSPSEPNAKDNSPTIVEPPVTNDAFTPPSNDVTVAEKDAVGGEAKPKKNRNRQKSDGKKGAAQNVKANNTDVRAELDAANQDAETLVVDGVEKERVDKKPRKRRPRQKPKSKAPDQTSQVFIDFCLKLLRSLQAIKAFLLFCYYVFFAFLVHFFGRYLNNALSVIQ